MSELGYPSTRAYGVPHSSKGACMTGSFACPIKRTFLKAVFGSGSHTHLTVPKVIIWKKQRTSSHAKSHPRAIRKTTSKIGSHGFSPLSSQERGVGTSNAKGSH